MTSCLYLSVVFNYRPVSLTSQICKVFEAIVRDEVVEFLDKHKLIRAVSYTHLTLPTNREV